MTTMPCLHARAGVLLVLVSSFVLRAQAAPPLHDAEWCEQQLDTAASTQSGDAKIAIYTNVLALIPSNTLAALDYDGASALFVTWAGLSWGYLHKADTNLLPQGLAYGLQARALGLQAGVPFTNPERFADHLHILGLYYEREPMSDTERCSFYHDETWEYWPYFNGDMLNLWRRKHALVYYQPAQAIPLALAVVDGAPFCNTLFYRNCGWQYVLLGQYREAFAIWQRGLIDGESHFWNSPTPERLIEFIEYATLDELRETKRLFQVNAAKYPATMENIGDVTGWLRWADHAHLNFELRLREAETQGDEGVVANLLREAVDKYRRPLYAEKLSDTNLLVRLLCDRMKEQVWWWAMPEYSLLPRTHALAHSSAATPGTAAYYTNTVNWLRDTHPAYVKRMQTYFLAHTVEEQ